MRTEEPGSAQTEAPDALEPPQAEDVETVVGAGTWWMDPRTRDETWSAGARLLLGVDAEAPLTLEVFLDRVLEQDRARVRAAFDGLARGLPVDVEHRIAAHGMVRWIRSRAEVRTDQRGETVLRFGTLQDVTPVHVAVDALERERQLLRTLFAAIPDPTWLKDPQGRFLLCNSAFARALGLPEASIVGRTSDEVMERATAQAGQRADRSALAANGPVRTEEWLRSEHSGVAVLFDAVRIPVCLGEPHEIGILGSARDVTALRRRDLLREVQRDLAVGLATTSAHADARELLLTNALRFPGVACGAIAKLDDDGELRIRRQMGFSPAFLANWSRARMTEEDRARLLADRAIVSWSEPALFSAATRREGLVSLVLIPIHANPAGIGALVLGSRDVRRLDDDLVAALEAMGRLYGATIGRLEAEAARARTAQILEARLRLSEVAATGTLHDLLVATLDEADALTDSSIGFYHFLEPDQRTLSLQAWSTRTTKEFCQAEGEGRHYDVAEAGVWVDAVRLRRAIVHNDYASLPHRRGLPPGHAHVARELVVPVLRHGLIVAILGVGNKEREYTREDVDVVTQLADVAWDLVERHRSERMYRSVLESSRDAFVAVDSHGCILEWSRQAEQLFGWPSTEVLGRLLTDTIVPPAARARVNAEFARFASSGAVPARVLRQTAVRRDGAQFPVDVQICSTLLGGSWRLSAFIRDMTERVLADEQLAQAQKLEAVGQLTGGLAHDFNNILGIIIGSLELLDPQPTPDAQELVRAAVSAARRAAEVTTALLAVARRQALSPREVDVNRLLRDLEPLLVQTAGRGVTITMDTEAYPASALLDAGGFNSAVINLVLNARDAMPDGGVLTIRTDAVTLAPDDQGLPPDSAPGPYLSVLVEDSGVGMSAEVAARAFDPFFTTKSRGKGTGLGLAMVYGFAKQSGGTATVDTEPGRGTRVRMLLPIVPDADEEPAGLPPARTAAVPTGALERVLVVDDEPDLLRITTTWLSSLGYTVDTTSNGEHALAMLDRQPFQLLVTDVVMPGMDGITLAARATERHPGLHVLLVSGYVDVQGARLDGRWTVLSKPFDRSQLGHAVRKVISG